MNRLAVAVALALLPMTSGCMFITPTTGLCVGDFCKTFEASRTEVATALANQPAAPQPLQYRTTDFELTFPGIWGELTLTTQDEAGKPVTVPLRDQTEASGLSTLRIAVGGLVPAEEGRTVSEGIRVITLNSGFDASDPAKAEASVADIARRSIAASFEGTPEIAEAKAKLGGKDAYQVSMLGRSLVRDQAGQPVAGAGVPLRVVARAVMHRAKAYIVMLSTPEARYGSAKDAYDGLFEGFKLLDADPTYVIPSPAPSPAGSGSPAPAASGSPAPGASGAPSPAASGSPSASPSPAGSPSPAASASPAASPAP